MDDPVPVSLKAGTDVALGLVYQPPFRLIAEGGIRAQIFVLTLFLHFSDSNIHSNLLLISSGQPLPWATGVSAQHKTHHRLAGICYTVSYSFPFRTLATVRPLDTGRTWATLKNQFGKLIFASFQCVCNRSISSARYKVLFCADTPVPLENSHPQ